MYVVYVAYRHLIGNCKLTKIYKVFYSQMNDRKTTISLVTVFR